jgi:hypothetical protein
MAGAAKFLATLIIGIALIWLGFWWYAQSRLQSGFTDWAEKQATNGVKISYDSIHRGTSILDAAITIDNLTLTLPPAPDGTAAAISLPAVTLRIHALDPLVFHTDLPDKIGFDSGKIDLVCNTGSIALTENLDPDKLFSSSASPFRGGDFSAGNVDILASEGSLLVLHIDAVSSHAELNPEAGAASIAVYSKTAFDGLAISPLLTRLASIPFGGKLAHLELAARISGPEPPDLPAVLNQLDSQPHDLADERKSLVPLIHKWAAQGGSGTIALRAILGPSTIDAAGAVKFDANLQPEGTADLTANHLDQFTGALTDSYPALQGDIARAEAQLSPYLGDSDLGGQTLTLHVVYGTPGVFINGQKTADMPPLDWTAAENPAPAIQAPGDGSGAAGPGAAGPPSSENQ